MKYIAIPKSILFSDDLYASTKRYAAAQLSFRRDEKNRFRKPLRYLAERANLCVSTARQAISQLEEIGFLTQERTYRYDAEKDTVIYDATIYTLNVDLSCGYVLISYKALRKFLSSELTHAAFVVALLLLCRQGLGSDHAWSSLRKTAKDTGLSKATVCRALLALIRLKLLLRLHGIRRTGGFFCNSYFILVNVAEGTVLPSEHCNQYSANDDELQASEVVSFLAHSPVTNIT